MAGGANFRRSETPLERLAVVQHELRLPRHPVGLGTGARQHVDGIRATGSPTGPGVTGLARGAEANPGAPWDVVMVGGACLLTAGLAWVWVAPDVGGERGHAGEAASTIP